MLDVIIRGYPAKHLPAGLTGTRLNILLGNLPRKLTAEQNCCLAGIAIDQKTSPNLVRFLVDGLPVSISTGVHQLFQLRPVDGQITLSLLQAGIKENSLHTGLSDEQINELLRSGSCLYTCPASKRKLLLTYRVGLCPEESDRSHLQMDLFEPEAKTHIGFLDIRINSDKGVAEGEYQPDPLEFGPALVDQFPELLKDKEAFRLARFYKAFWDRVFRPASERPDELPVLPDGMEFLTWDKAGIVIAPDIYAALRIDDHYADQRTGTFQVREMFLSTAMRICAEQFLCNVFAIQLWEPEEAHFEAYYHRQFAPLQLKSIFGPFQVWGYLYLPLNDRLGEANISAFLKQQHSGLITAGID